MWTTETKNNLLIEVIIEGGTRMQKKKNTKKDKYGGSLRVTSEVT